MKKYTNNLINESSPYLLQHAHNPVNWHPWSEEALALAKKENKLVIVSVGYAACHWCHVMEHESFEDENVAALMNRYYVSIKVDREERPDVDQVYMDAAQVLTGRGGWPLNVIALPDGRPIYAGTYFNMEQWVKVLKGVYDFYSKTPEKALEQAMLVSSGVNKLNIVPQRDEVEFPIDKLNESAENWLNSMDMREGGRRGKMKFPMPKAYQALLNYATLNQNKKAEDAVLLTLDKMAMGGIYDQVGGGFARYSVDPYWHVPHFEKMLYDNAQLITLYSEAYKYTGNAYYKQVVEETISFCNRELGSEEGSFYSSLDADSEGEEGKFYVWSEQEIDDLLGEDSPVFKVFYGVEKNGNWEYGKNVLKISSSVKDLSTKFKLGEVEIINILNKAKNILFEARENRIRPELDDKVLTSWNGLMVTGLSRAYEATGIEKYRSMAEKTGNFLWDKMRKEKQLFRTRKNGRSTINAFLDDYVFTIMGFTDLYQVTFDMRWLKRCRDMIETLNLKFFDSKSGLYMFKSNEDNPLYVKKIVIEDNVIPSGNSAMALNLHRLGHLLSDEEYINRSKTMLGTTSSIAMEHASFYYNWFELYQAFNTESSEVVIIGDDFDIKRKLIAQVFMPHAQLIGGSDEGSIELLKGRKVKGKTMIYVCRNKTCQLPTEDVETALKLIKEDL